jgi:hypothetical protein
MELDRRPDSSAGPKAKGLSLNWDWNGLDHICST